MTTVLRPRLDAVVVLDGGERHELSTRLADMMALQKSRKGKPLEGDGADSTELVYLAGVRLELWNGTFDAWVERVEDIEVSTAPPLAGDSSSPGSSPQQLEPQESPPTTSPASS